VASLFLIALLTAFSPGDPAPDFSAKNQDGKVVRLSDFKGKFVLIYFYPKDDTPGCTKEACAFRDVYSKIRQKNAVVFGVSRQDEKSHQEFRVKHKLPFDLLVDADGALAKSFDVGTIPMLGFAKRESILIGPDGKVVQVYKDVDPSAHARQILEDIDKATFR
jgi:peroxiredoxin Q/BCP